MSQIKSKYNKETLSELKKKFNYNNELAVPRIKKVIVNTGFNPNEQGKEFQEEVSKSLALITGQKPSVKEARKAIAGFKIREGMVVGLTVTLRQKRMYDFLDRLVHIALPRSRDFRGLPLSNIDQAGNLNIGIKEHIIFPEISAENAKNIFGFQVTVVTTAKNKEEGGELFRLLGFPIKFQQ